MKKYKLNFKEYLRIIFSLELWAITKLSNYFILLSLYKLYSYYSLYIYFTICKTISIYTLYLMVFHWLALLNSEIFLLNNLAVHLFTTISATHLSKKSKQSRNKLSRNKQIGEVTLEIKFSTRGIYRIVSFSRKNTWSKLTYWYLRYICLLVRFISDLWVRFKYWLSTFICIK